MRTLATSKLTSKQQLTLPRPVRLLLGVGAGDSLLWQIDEKGRVVLEPGRQFTLAEIRAAVAAAGGLGSEVEPATVEDMKAGIVRHIRSKHARG